MAMILKTIHVPNYTTAQETLMFVSAHANINTIDCTIKDAALRRIPAAFAIIRRGLFAAELCIRGTARCSVTVTDHCDPEKHFTSH